MKDRCPVVFVNAVAVNGFQNGVVNVALATFGFTPSETPGETEVLADSHITANLRMDLFCAQQLRDALDRILRENTKPAPDTVN